MARLHTGCLYVKNMWPLPLRKRQAHTSWLATQPSVESDTCSCLCATRRPAMAVSETARQLSKSMSDSQVTRAGAAHGQGLQQGFISSCLSLTNRLGPMKSRAPRMLTTHDLVTERVGYLLRSPLLKPMGLKTAAAPGTQHAETPPWDIAHLAAKPNTEALTFVPEKQ